MPTATLALGSSPSPRGPALRRFRLPMLPLVLSAAVHIGLIVATVVGAAMWRSNPSRTYIVNLVPAVAAVGLPQSKPAPALPPRVEEPAPRPAPRAPSDLPARDSTPALPERALPPPALPRPGAKDLPDIAPLPRVTRQTPAPPIAVASKTEVPPPPVGRPSGSSQGTAPVTLEVSDFPYAWYIRQITRKIQEQWEGRALPGSQPQIVFSIARDGQIRQVTVGKSSGNPAYDQIALRAVAAANPFPELPQDFEKPVLTVGLQFGYAPP